MKSVSNFLYEGKVKKFTKSFVKLTVGNNNWLRNMYKLGNLDTQITVGCGKNELKYVGYSQNRGFESLYTLYNFMLSRLGYNDTAYLMALYDSCIEDSVVLNMRFVNFPELSLYFKKSFKGFKLARVNGDGLENFLSTVEDINYLNFIFTETIAEISNSVPLPVNRLGLWVENYTRRSLDVNCSCAVGFHHFSNGEYDMVVLAKN